MDRSILTELAALREERAAAAEAARGPTRKAKKQRVDCGPPSSDRSGDAALARSLQAADERKMAQRSAQCAEDERLARSLQSEGGSAPIYRPTSSSAAATAAAPWPQRVSWREAQHEIGRCGNFDHCSKGNSFFVCDAMGETTAHGIEPVPLPGQTITYTRLPHVRKGEGVKHRPGVDGVTTQKRAQTRAFTPFTMGLFEGHVETIVLNRSAGTGAAQASSPPPGGERVFVLRNFDGVRGRRLARALEGAYGVDVLEGKGTGAKCAAAQGNNCQDDYRKVYPPRMFLDAQMAEVLRPLLDGAIAAVNASITATESSSPPSAFVSSSASAPASAASRRPRPGKELISLRRGERASAELTAGEAQILRFKQRSGGGGSSSSRRGGGGGRRGNRMHVHLDKHGTRWVALLSLGATSKFVVDNALLCERCFIRSTRPEHAARRIAPNLSRGGTGAGAGEAKQWHTFACPSCREIDLQSGDVLLFFGDPRAAVAHGSLDTVPTKPAEDAGAAATGAAGPSGLPAWCDGVRVSCQYRLTTTYGVTSVPW